MNVGTFPKQ